MSHKDIICPCCLNEIESTDKIVITEENYDLALKLVEIYMTGDPKQGTLQAKLLDLIAGKVEQYELKTFCDKDGKLK